jgi:hypothetical protein
MEKARLASAIGGRFPTRNDAFLPVSWVWLYEFQHQIAARRDDVAPITPKRTMGGITRFVKARAKIDCRGQG